MLNRIIPASMIIILAVVAVPKIALANDQESMMVLQSWSKKITGKKRFEILSAFNDQAVLDKETGLVWERSPSIKPRTWYEAVGDCRSKNVGDRLGWRLPAIEELASLVDPT